MTTTCLKESAKNEIMNQLNLTKEIDNLLFVRRLNRINFTHDKDLLSLFNKLLESIQKLTENEYFLFNFVNNQVSF
jgi:hypothetical protein